MAMVPCMTNLKTSSRASVVRKLTYLAVLAGFTLTLSAAAASADTLVYVKGGAVYAAHPNGSQARAITSAGNGWAWPSETDGGIIAAAGGLSRVNGSFNPSGGDQIYEFDQQGRQVAGPVATQGTYSTVSDPEYVSHFRVAPDNSNVAWTDTSSFTNPDTSWRNPNGSGTFSAADDSDGAPLPYSSPEWWGPGHLLITHDGTQMSGNAEYALYSLADGSSPGWSDDEAIGAAPSYQVAISRDGLRFAVMTDDGPDYGGTIHNVGITLETTKSEPATAPVSDTHCTITLPASEVATSHASSLASMSFSSDGSTLAWAQDDGVYEANVSNPNDCASVTDSVRLVVPGGQMPFLGAAPLSPSQGGGSGTPSSGGGGQGTAGSQTHGSPARVFASFTYAPRRPRASHKVQFNALASHGAGARIVRYSWAFGDGTKASGRSARTAHAFRRPGHYRVRVTVTDAAAHRATFTQQITVRKSH
jgi:hypothetical protein